VYKSCRCCGSSLIGLVCLQKAVAWLRIALQGALTKCGGACASGTVRFACRGVAVLDCLAPAIAVPGMACCGVLCRQESVQCSPGVAYKVGVLQ